MSIFRTLRNTRRLLKIAVTLAREDALFILRDLGFQGPIMWLGGLFARKSTLPQPQRLAHALERLGPTFIKLGQTLSTRPDLVGEEVSIALAELRDNLPPFDSKVARALIEEELRQSIGSVFQAFEDQAVAAASIAQVHRAVLHDGRKVAVKILRPGIAQAFARDMDLFYWIAELIERNLRSWRRLKPLAVVELFKQTVAFELDLRYEAAAATEMRDNVKNDEGFRVPAVEWNLTTQKVMVLDWVEGIPLADVESIKNAGHDVNAVLARLSENFFKHVFRDGFFHADLHPGNLFLDAAGNIVAVDFGIMGRLDWRTRLYVAEILRGFLNEDYRHVAEAHFAAGYVRADQSVENFTLACMAIAKPILDKPLHDISVARLLGQLLKVTETFAMETQPQLLLLQKTMVVVEGIGRMFNPRINMWEMARSPIEAWAEANLGPIGKLQHGAWEMSEIIRELPRVLARANTVLERLSDSQGVRLHPESVVQVLIERHVQQRYWNMLASVALIAAVFILAAKWAGL